MSDAVEKSAAVPPVDLELLRALVNRELPEKEARQVYRLILTRRDWDEAHEQLLLEKLDEIKARGGPSF